MTREQILHEIRRTANANGGVPLGLSKFETETGLRRDDCVGVYWSKWSEAQIEAGYAPNRLTTALSEELFLRKYAELAIALGRMPRKTDM